MALRCAALLAAIAVLGCNDPTASDPSDDPPPRFGFTATALHHPPVASPRQVVESASRITPGAVLRISIHWRTAQPEADDEIELDRYETIAGAAARSGLRPLLLVTAAPEWTWGNPCDPRLEAERGFCILPPSEAGEDLAAWRRFVRAVVNRLGESAVGLEVWNEPNGGGFWTTPTGPDPDHYARLLCSAKSAVRTSRRPLLPIVLGGLANARTDDRHLSPAAFLTALYASPREGVSQCMDAIGIHPYPRQTSPLDPGSPFQIALASVRRVRDANGDSHLPLWITEFGYWTRGPGALAESVQARFLSCAVRISGSEADIGAFVVHDLIDRGTDAVPDGSFGVFRRPASTTEQPVEKPAAAALATQTEGEGTPPEC